MDPAWAVRFVPQWAAFAAKLGFTGIHWDTFGDFGHYEEVNGPKNPFQGDKGAPKPDIPGFLRAALPILQKYGLLQTLNFVNGFGWDPALLREEVGKQWEAQVGRIIAFPYWEVWSPAKEKEFLETVAKDSNGFVVSMYPGYSKYHCCLKNERQNAAEYGVWPFELGMKRWKRAIAAGGTYHLVVDGLRYLQGPFVPDAVRFGSQEVEKLQGLLSDKHPGASHLVYIYSTNDEGAVFRQPLLLMTPETDWEMVSSADSMKIMSMGFDSDTMYAVNVDERVVQQHLMLLTQDPSWALASAGRIKSIAISGDTIYGVTTQNTLVKQSLSGMTMSSAWSDSESSAGEVTSIFIYGYHIYGVDENLKVVKKSLYFLQESWQTVSAVGVTSVAIFGDTIYGSSVDKQVVKQTLSQMTLDSAWTPASKGTVASIGLLVEASI
mmetsp:Transcript_27122/g.77625  ORF Transcript_27122/g.77625 Transcript_27122/m.77625 type:complete len:436 (-) Transcript_27122:66-1373(-)